MMSIDMKRAVAIAKKYDGKLLATDPRFNGVVLVNSTDDNSHFVYTEAFTVCIWLSAQKWYLVFTEHYGYHVFCSDAVTVTYFSKREAIQKLEIDNYEKK